MGKKQKRKLTAAERRARCERRKTTRIIFINGKQKRVPRLPMIEGLPVDEFIRRNADPIWLHENGMWEYMDTEGTPDLEPDLTFDDEPEYESHDEPDFSGFRMSWDDESARAGC